MSFNSQNVSQGNTPPFQIGFQGPLPDELPILSLHEMVFFPLMFAPLVITDESQKVLIEEVMKTDRLVAVFHPDTMALDVEEAPEPSDREQKEPGAGAGLFPVGTLCSVLRMLRVPDGSLRLLVHGICRIRIDQITETKPVLRGSIQAIEEPEHNKDDLEVEALMKLTFDNLQKAISYGAVSEELAIGAMNVEGPGKLADLVASHLQIRPKELLGILGEPDAKTRLRLVQDLLVKEIHVLEIGNRINDEVREEVDKNQRSFFLHQQMRAIRKELGETDPHEAELDELAERLQSQEMPEYARETAAKEFSRLQGMPTAAAEYGVIRTYLEWILDIPWCISSNDRIDISHAADILDKDHYGLEEIKERIVEFLSVIRLKGGDLKGPILCLVGPPGVGKTSLGRSIARATGREFQNFSLGGMRDEAEIRGHRRTYIGSMPGRIVKSLKEAGTNNPLIMLDEIDKLGSDFRGDPASALLEVLDPEQNNHFTDHYMDMPVDLSKVMFITTANTLDTIPGPLRDRMEIIRIAGYTDMEKLEIAQRYLIPREMKNAGILKKHLSIHKTALRRIITDYTAEAGVRNLQREIGKVCRKVARKVAELESEKDRLEAAQGKNSKAKKKKLSFKKVSVAEKDLKNFLGTKKSYQELAERTSRPGVSTGLAWTSVGGAILFIEAVRYPGKGELRLTGQLGEVMKESGAAAFTYLKANQKKFGLNQEDFQKYDYHVHVPAGATPKDGPSAGTAIATALASLITGRRVRDFVAMTGEITLRGNVMPVGGIKEKCLAAHRSGVKEVFLPDHNRGDYEEVPEQIVKNLKVRFFSEAGEYLDHALEKS